MTRRRGVSYTNTSQRAHRPRKAGLRRAYGHSALCVNRPGGALSRCRQGQDRQAGRVHALQLEPEGPQVCIRPQSGPIQALQWVSSLRPKAIRIKPAGNLWGLQRPRVTCSCLPRLSRVPADVPGSQASKGQAPARHHLARVAHPGTRLRAVTLTPASISSHLTSCRPVYGFPETPGLPGALLLMGCFCLPSASTHHHWRTQALGLLHGETCSPRTTVHRRRPSVTPPAEKESARPPETDAARVGNA